MLANSLHILKIKTIFDLSLSVDVNASICISYLFRIVGQNREVFPMGQVDIDNFRGRVITIK